MKKEEIIEEILKEEWKDTTILTESHKNSIEYSRKLLRRALSLKEKQFAEAVENFELDVQDLNDTFRKDNTIWISNGDELNDLWEEKIKELVKKHFGSFSNHSPQKKAVGRMTHSKETEDVEPDDSIAKVVESGSSSSSGSSKSATDLVRELREKVDKGEVDLSEYEEMFNEYKNNLNHSPQVESKGQVLRNPSRNKKSKYLDCPEDVEPLEKSGGSPLNEIWDNPYDDRWNLNSDSNKVLPYTRLTLVDENGRIYERFNIQIEQDIQDEGKTLKLFVKDNNEIDIQNAIDDLQELKKKISED